jgi:arabinan endo-1,5-alpha-L-arabinosidase
MREGGPARGLSPLLAVLLTGWALAQTETLPTPAGTQAQTYTNPVVTPVAADPDVIRAPDGTFYLYATQDDWSDGRGEHYLPIFRSDDLVNWTFVKDAFALPLGARPSEWKSGAGFYWAPDISFRDGTYYLYYAASLWGDPNPCIGLATAEHPEGPWEDLGRAVFCSEDIGVENSIDPEVWDEDGTRTMVWGSGHGIYAVTLSEDGTEAVGEPVQLAGDTLYFEAPYITQREGYYYLFLSAGTCCEGEWSTYTLYVGRSEDLTGPYLDSEGRDMLTGGGDIILARNDVWAGPGHNTVVTDDEGVDWIIYHGIPIDDPVLPSGATRRPALLDRLEWEDGWPVVNGGAGPSHTEQAAPTVEGAP